MDELTNTQRRWPALMCKVTAAAYLDISARTLERLTGEGTLPTYQLRKRTIRLKKNDLDRYIAQLPTSVLERPGT